MVVTASMLRASASSTARALRTLSSPAKVAPKHFVLAYEYIDGVLEKRGPFRAEHLELARAHVDAEHCSLVLGGAFADMAGAQLVFRTDDADHVRAFAEKDPYVTNGLVRKFTVREWTTLLGSAMPSEADVASESAAAPSDGVSFIDRAKAGGANALLGAFTYRSKRFDRCMRALRIEKVGKGEIECSLVVPEELLNGYGTLHGGATSTLVDVAGTLALLSRDAMRPGVSVEMNTSFLSAAKPGEHLTITSRVLKAGRRLGFTEVERRSASAAFGDCPASTATFLHV